MDRCFGNSEWFNIFPNSHQWFLEKLGSDQRLVLVKFINDQEVFRGQFRFDKRLADDPNCMEAVFNSWSGYLSTNDADASSMVRLFNCRKAISCWKKTTEFNAKSRIKRLLKELDVAKSVQFPCWSRISDIQN